MNRKLTPEEWEHGNANTYANHGCRCDKCSEANRIRMRRYRERHHPKGAKMATKRRS